VAAPLVVNIALLDDFTIRVGGIQGLLKILRKVIKIGRVPKVEPERAQLLPTLVTTNHITKTIRVSF
jgi:hypothetical protein